MYAPLTDETWEKIEYFLPPVNANGRPRANDRAVLNGILYMYHHDCQWKELPREIAAYSTCWRRVREWRDKNVWSRIASILKSDLGIEVNALLQKLEQGKPAKSAKAKVPVSK